MRTATTFRQAILDVLGRYRVHVDEANALADDISFELMKLALHPAAYNITWDGELTTNIYLSEEDAAAAMKRLDERFHSGKREIVPLYHAPISAEVHSRMMVAKAFLSSPEVLDELLLRAGVDVASVPEDMRGAFGSVVAETTIHVCEKIAGLNEKVTA